MKDILPPLVEMNSGKTNSDLSKKMFYLKIILHGKKIIGTKYYDILEEKRKSRQIPSFFG